MNKNKNTMYGLIGCIGTLIIIILIIVSILICRHIKMKERAEFEEMLADLETSQEIMEDAQDSLDNEFNDSKNGLLDSYSEDPEALDKLIDDIINATEEE